MNEALLDVQDLTVRFGGLTASPLRGPAGNREFFVLWTVE